MKQILIVLTLVLALSLVVAGAVWAQEAQPNQPEAGAEAGTQNQLEAGELALLLAPLVAAATAIERILEMLFDWVESVIRNTGSFLKLGGDYLKQIKDEIGARRQVVTDLLKKPASAINQDLLGQAEDALDLAEGRMVDYLKSPEYTSLKRSISLFLGLVLGPILTFSVGLGMFNLLGIELAPWIDKLVTGLIIGTGSAPVHSLIGLLQNTRDAVDEARGLWSSKRLREGVEAIEAEYRAKLEEIKVKQKLGAAPAQPSVPDHYVPPVKIFKNVLDKIDPGDLLPILREAPSEGVLLKISEGEEGPTVEPVPPAPAGLADAAAQIRPASWSNADLKRLVRSRTS